jgi:hypothetical protein
MPRVYSICTHTDRLAIETALRAHLPLRTIAVRWSVSKTALLRHRDRHMGSAPATPPAAEPPGAIAPGDIEVSQCVVAPVRLAVADAGAQALAAYQDALALYDVVRQRDISSFPGLTYGLLQIQRYQVDLAYQ